RRHTRFSRDWSSDVCSSDLVLQGLGAGRNDRLAAACERRDEIGECLAGTRARFYDELSMFLERLGDGLGHEALARARLEPREMNSEWAFLAKEISEVLHDRAMIQGPRLLVTPSLGAFSST